MKNPTMLDTQPVLNGSMLMQGDATSSSISPIFFLERGFYGIQILSSKRIWRRDGAPYRSTTPRGRINPTPLSEPIPSQQTEPTMGVGPDGGVGENLEERMSILVGWRSIQINTRVFDAWDPITC